MTDISLIYKGNGNIVLWKEIDNVNVLLNQRGWFFKTVKLQCLAWDVKRNIVITNKLNFKIILEKKL